MYSIIITKPISSYMEEQSEKTTKSAVVAIIKALSARSKGYGATIYRVTKPKRKAITA